MNIIGSITTLHCLHCFFPTRHPLPLLSNFSTHTALLAPTAHTTRPSSTLPLIRPGLSRPCRSAARSLPFLPFLPILFPTRPFSTPIDPLRLFHLFHFGICSSVAGGATMMDGVCVISDGMAPPGCISGGGFASRCVANMSERRYGMSTRSILRAIS